MTINLESSPDSQTRVIPVDVEHGAIRVLLPVLAIGGFIAGFFLTTWLINTLNIDTASGCVAFLVGLGLAAFATLTGNRLLARLFPGGRSLCLGPDTLEFRDRKRSGTASVTIDWNQRINVLAWRFTVPRTTVRAQKGWYMLGIQLLQDDAVLSLYTFMSPQEAALVPHYDTFKPLLPRTAVQNNEISLRDLAEQRRLLQAEDERWQHGAEVQRADFAALIAAVAQRVAEQARQYKADQAGALEDRDGLSSES